VREAGKRALIEAGARKEIAMIVPVVVLITRLGCPTQCSDRGMTDRSAA